MYIYHPETGRGDPNAIGGKAANLEVLASLNLSVPRWFAITTHAFRAAVNAEPGLDARIRDRLASADDENETTEALSEIRGWIGRLELPPKLRATVLAEYREQMADVSHVAVRSSAADEDNPEQSFAGIHDSILFVSGE